MAVFAAPRMSVTGNPEGAETPVASVTLAAGATQIFDGTPSGGGARDTSPVLFVRYASAVAGQSTMLKFADVAG